MKLSYRLFCALAVLSVIIPSALGQTTRPNAAQTKPAAGADMKINMNRVKLLLEKAAEAGKTGNDVEQGKYLAELTEIARQAWDFKDVTTSETVFRQILTVKGDYADALFGLAELYRRTNPVWAADLYTKYLQVNPSEARAYYGRGSCYLARDAFTLAMQDLKYMVEQLAPNDVAGLTNLALACRGRAVERNKDPELFKQAVDYMKRGVQAAEVSTDQETLAMLPELRYRLGRLVFEYENIAAAARGDADFKEAISYLMQAIQSAYQAASRDPENIKLLDQIIYAMDALSEVYSAQSQMNPKAPEPYLQLAQIVLRKIDIQTRQSQVLALSFYKKALVANPNAAGIWFDMGGVYSQLGAPKNALECLERAIKLTPDNAEYKKIRDQMAARMKAGNAQGANGKAQTPPKK